MRRKIAGVKNPDSSQLRDKTKKQRRNAKAFTPSGTKMKPLLGSVSRISVDELVGDSVEVVINPFVVEEEYPVGFPRRCGRDGGPAELRGRQPELGRRKLFLVFRQIPRNHCYKDINQSLRLMLPYAGINSRP